MTRARAFGSLLAMLVSFLALPNSPLAAQLGANAEPPLPFALRPQLPAPYRPTVPVLAEPGGRHTKRGAIIGAAVGGLTGLGAGIFIAAWCGVEGESGGCPGAIPILTLFGAGTGALGGAIIGAAIPRTVRDTAVAEPVAATAPEAPNGDVAPASARAVRGRVGSASVALGAAAAPAVSEAFSGESDWRGGAGLKVNLFAELGTWFALGPQFGQAWLARDFAVRHAALAMRASRTGPRFSPYLVADVGAYQTRQGVSIEGVSYAGTLEFLGGSIGAGTRWFASSNSRAFLDLDARWHRNLQNIERFEMASISLALGRTW